jgi:hypothetical protein
MKSRVKIVDQCCALCCEWAAAAPPAKGFCPALERQTWGCQWCQLFAVERSV